MPGALRLGLELAFFAAAVWGLAAAGGAMWALALAALVALHYLASYDRVLRLLRR